MNISWSPDGTQILSGSSSGNIVFGHVVEREVIYKNLKATITGRRMIVMKDIVNNTTDSLDFSDRVIKWELGYGHLVVATPNQLHIFNENYINTPIIIDRAEVRIISLAKK
jgi:intraflagellar transport protein 80